MVLFVVMVVTAAALVVLMLMMVTTAAFVMFLMLVMMMTTTALVMLMLMMMTTAAGFPMFMVMVLPLPAGCMGRIPGVDHHIRLNGPGNADHLGDQRIRVGSSEPQLLGGEGNGGLLHFRVGIELCLDLGGAVGAVQIVDDVYLSGHREPSFDFDI
jgi:hypothetical protein